MLMNAQETPQNKCQTNHLNCNVHKTLVMHIQCSRSSTHITNTKQVSTFEANLPMLVNEVGAKQSTDFGVFTKHLADTMFTKQCTYH